MTTTTTTTASTTSAGAGTATRPRLQVDTRMEPWPGEVLDVAAGTCLEVRFRRRSDAGPWRVEGCPPHLVPLAETDQGVLFLVFAGPAQPGRRADPLRLVRQRRGRPGGVRDERQVAVRVDA